MAEIRVALRREVNILDRGRPKQAFLLRGYTDGQ